MATKPPASPTLPSSLIETCPRYEHAMQILGKRWTGLLINALMKGPRRFCELTSLVEGLSDRVCQNWSLLPCPTWRIHHAHHNC